MPDIMIIQLKRFQYIPGQYFVHRDKISDLVNFPIEGLGKYQKKLNILGTFCRQIIIFKKCCIDLTEFVKGPIESHRQPVYDLYAVSEHSGGLGGGHYTAVCRNSIDKKW